MRKILILRGDSLNYRKPFDSWGTIYDNPDVMEDCDLIVFTGGTDITTKLYGQPKLGTTDTPDRQRDTLEHAIYVRALILQLPMVGICRGMQFLNIMNNGTLIQHIEEHTMSTHSITNTDNYGVVRVAGDHHQSILPTGNYKLIDSSSDGVVETIFWNNTRCLGVQWHPEWMEENSKARIYFNDLLNEYVM